MRSPFLIVVLAVVLGCFLDALVKHITLETALITMTAWRFVVGAAIAIPVYLAKGHRMPSASALRFHLMRAAVQIVAILSFFWALTQLALAEATTLGFTAALMMPLLARMILRERLSPIAGLAGILGFAGAALAVSATPGGAPEDGDRVLGAAAALLAAFTYALAVVLLRLRTRSDDTETLALFNNLYPGIFFGVLLFGSNLVGQPVSPLWPASGGFVWVVLLGFLGFAVWWLMSMAYRDAEAQLLAPFEYLALPLSASLGFFLFGETPGWQLYIGALIIILACLAVAFESRIKWRRPMSDPLT